VDSSTFRDEGSKRHHKPDGINDDHIQRNRNNHIIDSEDEEEIPFTHKSSRSASPFLIDSDDMPQDYDKSGAIEGKPSDDVIELVENAPIISIDDAEADDDDLKEYFVITDEEDNEQPDDDDNDGTVHKSTNEQLQENQKLHNSNLNMSHCAICFESPKMTFALPCGHLYCQDCVFKAISSTKQSTKSGGPCSLCRTYTSYRNVTLAIFKKKKKTLINE
jgi:hypothetical protein